MAVYRMFFSQAAVLIWTLSFKKQTRLKWSSWTSISE
jgi:hypothetical protein